MNDKVVVANSVTSEHIWFILGGSCDIYLYVDLNTSNSTSLPPQVNTPRGSPERNNYLPNVALCEDSTTRSWIKQQQDGDFEMSREPTPHEENANGCVTFNQQSSSNQRGFFVKCGHLVRGDHFGMASIRGNDARHLSLVSRGTEILRVPKTTVLKALGPTDAKLISKRSEKIPADKYLRNEYDAQTEWDAFKKSLVEVTARRRKNGKSTLSRALFHVLQGPENDLRPHTASARDLRPICYERSSELPTVVAKPRNFMSACHTGQYVK